MPSVHQTRPAQGQIWLVKTRNHDIYGYFPCGRMGAHSNAPAVLVHNTYLYLQSVEHLYLYTFRLCVAPYLLTPGCVSHLCGNICLLCIFAIIIFVFFSYSPCGGTLQGIDDRSWWQRKIKGQQRTFKKRHTLVLLYLFLCLSRQTRVYMLNMDYHFLIIFHLIFSQSLLLSYNLSYIILKYCTCPLWLANLLLETYYKLLIM